MVAIPKPVRELDSSYLDFIRLQPCLVSATILAALSPCVGPIDPHHVKPVGGGKTGSKVNDDRAVPLCREHHISAERSRKAFEEHYAVSFDYEIERLQGAYQKLPRKPKRERSVIGKIKSHLIECSLCGQIHRVPHGKAGISPIGLEYYCRVRKANAVVQWKRGA